MRAPAKWRFIAAAIAAVLGLAGALALAGGTGLWLMTWLAPPAAFLLSGVALVAIAGLGAWIAVRPTRSMKDEAEEMMETAAAAFADLPADLARKLIAERPIAALALSSGIGALLARRPQVAGVLLERLLARLL